MNTPGDTGDIRIPSERTCACEKKRAEQQMVLWTFLSRDDLQWFGMEDIIPVQSCMLDFG